MTQPITVVLIALMLVSVGAQAQQRVKKKGPADFDGLHQALGAAWAAGEYGKATAQARELMALVSLKRSEAIVAAMPAAPAGYAVVPPRKKRNEANNPLAGMAAMMGSVASQKYRAEGKNGRLEVNVTADSPVAQMFKVWATNPAALGPDAELIKYNDADAILKKQRRGWSLQILLGKDVIEVKSSDALSDEQLLGWMNQAALDKLAAALNK